MEPPPVSLTENYICFWAFALLYETLISQRYLAGCAVPLLFPVKQLLAPPFFSRTVFLFVFFVFD